MCGARLVFEDGFRSSCASMHHDSLASPDWRSFFVVPGPILLHSFALVEFL